MYDDDPPIITVTDLRQYSYCPRVVYYTGMLPRPLTNKMRTGTQAHQDEEDRERRRSLRVYQLEDGERLYGQHLEDQDFGVRGTLDMLVLRPEEVIPIEHKLSGGPLAATHRVQLMAYGLLAARAYGRPALRGYVYWIPERRTSQVSFTLELEAQVRALVGSVQLIRRSEVLPKPTAVPARCTDCEFRRFCGDRPRP